MYDYNDELDKLLEEAYLEGYYDSLNDIGYDKDTIHELFKNMNYLKKPKDKSVKLSMAGLGEKNRFSKYFNESVMLEYKNNISFGSSFSLVKKIVDSLTKEELSHICVGEFKNSPYIIYREVLLVNNKPAAFIDIYSIPKEMNKDEAVIVVACNRKFRKNGYVELLVERAIPIIKKENKIKYLYWETDKSNKASSNIAKKFKFKKAKDFDENDDNYVMNLSESYIEESSIKSNFIDNNDFMLN